MIVDSPNIKRANIFNPYRMMDMMGPRDAWALWFNDNDKPLVSVCKPALNPYCGEKYEELSHAITTGGILNLRMDHALCRSIVSFEYKECGINDLVEIESIYIDFDLFTGALFD